ncbi:MAG TPA: class I SAM-dependent methyltransferase [Marmoricola sp.]|nr:class I SAM-dependent methyltransferase [Marmoricola sp.]
MELLTADLVARLRQALLDADFRYDAVAGALGPVAHAALSRNETTPGLRATAGSSPVETLIRLWPLQAAVDVVAAEAALPGLVDPLCNAGLLERSVGSVRARLDVRPYADEHHDWWVVSDLTPGLDGSPNRVGPDHVLGISSASTSLAQLTVRTVVGTALDLGTGCGVQSLHLAGHAQQVVATDVNRRALAMTRLNAALNEVVVDVREGSLFEPVRGASYDLIVSNPPFVVSPGTGELLVYRDSGLPGDEMVRRVVTGAPQHLDPGGVAQVLANWVHVEGRPWQERLEGWLAPQEGVACDAWVVQREVADPAEYVELWLRDAGHDRLPDYAQRYDAWVGWFEERGITGVGFGWVNLRRTDRAEPSVRVEEWPYEVEQPLGPEVAAWTERTDLLADLSDDQLLARAWRRREDVRQETVGEPGAEDPEVIVLRQQRGMRRARQVDTVEAALVGASDGELTGEQLLDALATLLDRPVEALRPEVTATVHALVEDGFLVP